MRGDKELTVISDDNEPTRTIYVRCTFTIPVEVPVDPEYNAKFDIEENHCPGTGRVVAALDKLREQFDSESVCWACNLDGKNEIIDAPSDELRRVLDDWIV